MMACVKLTCWTRPSIVRLFPGRTLITNASMLRFSAATGDDTSAKAPLKKPTTPGGKLDTDESPASAHPYQEKEPLAPHPNNTHPDTGEIGGPRGPEPTRYGDWERKGRVSDF